MNLTNKKYTVITGASSGIGYATALAFAERDSNLILTARRQEKLQALKQQISGLHPTLDIIIKATDLSIPENALKLYADIKTLPLQTWINNAGLGNYASVGQQNIAKISQLLHLNVEALTILSTLFVRDFQNVEKTQLINVSSCGGYKIVPNAVTYCASKFYVSTFTEGLARELQECGAKMQAKVLAPAATQTEFGQIANDVTEYDYSQHFEKYHTSAQVAEFLLQLYDSSQVVGLVDRDNFSFHLFNPLFPYAGQKK